MKPFSATAKTYPLLICLSGNPNRPTYRGLSPSRPEMPKKKSRKCLPGPEAPEPRNSPKVSGTVRKHSPDTFRRLSRDFPDCPRDFLGCGGQRPKGHLRDFFGISVPESPRDPRKSARAPLCCKSMCCASRFCTGGGVAAGRRSKQCSRARKAKY